MYKVDYKVATIVTKTAESDELMDVVEEIMDYESAGYEVLIPLNKDTTLRLHPKENRFCIADNESWIRWREHYKYSTLSNKLIKYLSIK